MRGPRRSKLLLSACTQTAKESSTVAATARRFRRAGHRFERRNRCSGSGLDWLPTQVELKTIFQLLLKCAMERVLTLVNIGQRPRTVSKFLRRRAKCVSYLL